MAEILHQIEINASPEKIYQAITTEEGLKGWWTSDVVIEKNEQSFATFGFNDHSIVFKMLIEEEIPNKRVKWKCVGEVDDWVKTELYWEIEDNHLKFSHKNWKSVEGHYRRCNTTWGHLMVLLKNYCEGKNFVRYFN